MRKWLIAGGIVAVLVIVVLVAAQVAEEPVRRYAEQASNDALPEYRIDIGSVDLHPLTLTVDVRDVVVRQQANPEPALATIERVRTAVRLWPLFAGRVGANVDVERPIVAATGRQVDAFFKKGDAEEATQEATAWQDKVRDLLSLQVDLFLHDGEATYEGPPLAEPVHVRGLEVAAEGLTNRAPEDLPYPARFRVDLQLMEEGRLSLRGRADPLAKPIPAVETDVDLQSLSIAPVLKAMGKTDLPIQGGVVDVAGHVQYGPSQQSAVVDHVIIREPRIEYVATPSEGAAPEAREAGASAQPWQDRVQALFPITVRRVEVQNGSVAYRPDAAKAPVRIERLDVTTSNIVNRPVEGEQYPSEFRIAAALPDDGRVAVDGRADFFAKPLPRVDGKMEVQRLHLGSLEPVARQAHVYASQGVLDLSGRARYGDGRADVVIDQLLLDGAKIDYVYAAATKGQEQARAKQGARQAKQASRDPAVQIRVGHGQILHSEVGFVNQAASPDYRVFMADMNVEMDNLSTKPAEGTGALRLTGKFMGTGPTVVSGDFRPEKPTPDFDLRVKIVKTKVSSLNNVLRAYGGLDTKDGMFAFFSELSVRDNHIEGYVKPLLRDVDVYDPKQDRNKGMAKRLYEAVVGGVLGVLENEPRKAVATKADVTGEVENPQASTWQVVGNLVENAFFKAILPGFEQGPVG